VIQLLVLHALSYIHAVTDTAHRYVCHFLPYLHLAEELCINCSSVTWRSEGKRFDHTLYSWFYLFL